MLPFYQWSRYVNCAIEFAVILLAFGTAQASVLIRYEITIDQNVNVTDLAFWEKGDGLESLASPYSANAFTTTEIISLYPDPPYPHSSFMIGLVNDLPNDLVPGMTHVVLMMSEVAAANTLGLEWSTLFPNTDEADLINAIQNLNSSDFEQSVAASLFVFSFIENDVGAGYMFPDTTDTIPFYFAPGDAFSVVAFSQAQQIGSGQSSVERLDAVPEPPSAAIFAIGFAVLVGLSKWT